MGTTRHIRSTQSFNDWSRDLVTRHETLFFLVWKDLKVQYGNLALGLIWSVSQPLLYFGVILAVFHFGQRVAPDGTMPFPVFLFSGIVVWNFFTNAINGVVANVQANAGIISKSYFPRFYLVLSPVFRSCIDLVISLLLLLVVALAYDSDLSVNSLWSIPLAVLFLLTTTIGVASIAAVAVVYNRHVRQGIPMLLYAAIFVLPVFHTLSLADGTIFQAVYDGNPLAQSMNLVRVTFGGNVISINTTILATILSVGILFIGIAVFRKLERSLADRI